MEADERSRRQAFNRAWRALPGRTRRELVLTAVKGQEPRTDPATWRTALDWTELYPAQAVPQVAMAACFLWSALRGIQDQSQGVLGQLGWFVLAFACFLLVNAAWTTYAAFRIRRSPGPQQTAQPGQDSQHPVDDIRP